MIIIGTFIRGPGWQWFWPGQTWDHNRLIYEVNRDLPDLFRDHLQPRQGPVRGDRGLADTSRWAASPSSRFFRRYMPKDFSRMSLLQFSIMQVFLLIMVALPLKMMLRLLWHIKYVWITPWFNV